MEVLKTLATQGIEPNGGGGLFANRQFKAFVLIETQVALEIIEDDSGMLFLAFAQKCLNSVLETQLKNIYDFLASYTKIGGS